MTQFRIRSYARMLRNALDQMDVSNSFRRQFDELTVEEQARLYELIRRHDTPAEAMTALLAVTFDEEPNDPR